MEQIAVVTGANRGLGWGVSEALAEKGYFVVLTGRNFDSLNQKVNAIKAKNGKAMALVADMANTKSIDEAVSELKKKFLEIHLLVNNAGIAIDGETYAPEKVLKMFETNTLGPLHFTKGLQPLLEKGGANVINVSSGMGQLKDMNGVYPGYRISKTALNAVTKILSHELKGVRINSVCPGWVKTDMGGAGAERELAQGVASILAPILLDKNGPTGGYFRDGKSLDW